ncbi:DUF922 domain-containing protein [Roseisolibacter agri]|uniref:DUF922 domain-containing protein n=1 Tax=Roseisolibacter agri TaxID=2014610 RepID=A0AA37Q8N6_9BACT|nr:DUF922 domain-containing protein [Roseisolibacter agri]GLC25757.1 hypothetical protein rosag_22700 [Roseisolibacter agri]
MRRVLYARLAVVALLAGCASGGRSESTRVVMPPIERVPPGVQLSTRVNEYRVTAATIGALREEMHRLGPIADGVRYPGATHWDVRWTYEYEPRTAGCALRTVQARVETRVSLPRWEPATTPDSAVTGWWEGFHARLVAHEHGHVRLAVESAGAIVDALRPLTAGTCAALGERANAAGQSLLTDARRRQAAYDRDTRHGALPGG